MRTNWAAGNDPSAPPPPPFPKPPQVPSSPQARLRLLPRVALRQPGGRPPPGRGMLPPGFSPGGRRWGLLDHRPAGRATAAVSGERRELPNSCPVIRSASLWRRSGLGLSALTSGAGGRQGGREGGRPPLRRGGRENTCAPREELRDPQAATRRAAGPPARLRRRASPPSAAAALPGRRWPTARPAAGGRGAAGGVWGGRGGRRASSIAGQNSPLERNTLREEVMVQHFCASRESLRASQSFKSAVCQLQRCQAHVLFMGGLWRWG